MSNQKSSDARISRVINTTFSGARAFLKQRATGIAYMSTDGRVTWGFRFGRWDLFWIEPDGQPKALCEVSLYAKKIGVKWLPALLKDVLRGIQVEASMVGSSAISVIEVMQNENKCEECGGSGTICVDYEGEPDEDNCPACNP